MNRSMELSLDKLPVKRLDSIEENGAERFPPDVGYDEKRESLIRRIDFAWVVEKDENKKQKKSSKESSSFATTTPWQWKSMVENLQLAHQELSIIIDLINTVEANDAVIVASMTRPKLLPNEVLSDLSVSAATKLLCYRHLGKYFKQSAKSLEQQIAREARFYGALISALYDLTAVLRPSTLTTICVDRDSAGMLAISLPPNSCLSLCFGYLGAKLSDSLKESSNVKTYGLARKSKEAKDDVNDDECVRETISLLREVHQAIFDEQVFDMVNREAFNQSAGVNVTGIRENYLQMGVGQRTSIYLSLIPSSLGQTVENSDTQNIESAVLPLDSFDGVKSPEEKEDIQEKRRGYPNHLCYEIYLQQIFHEHLYIRAKNKPCMLVREYLGNQQRKSLVFSVISVCLWLIEYFRTKFAWNWKVWVPYLQLIFHPTWHSRTSSWTIFLDVPQSILHADTQSQASEVHGEKNAAKSHFRTKVVVNDDCINVEREGTPNVIGFFKGRSENISSVNKYDCNLADLPVIILQQVASQVIRWLYEEALTVGIKGNRDSLCLSFELYQGETVSLVAHVDPEDMQGCISWWLVMEDGLVEEGKLWADISNDTSDYRKFLGHLSLDVLYSTLMDLVSLCGGRNR